MGRKNPLSPSKPSGGIQTSPISIGVNADLGTIGGAKINISTELDAANLIPEGRISLGINTNSITGTQTLELGLGGEVSTVAGKFGLSVGGGLSLDNKGNITASGVSVGASAFGVYPQELMKMGK